MASEIRVNKINSQTGVGTITLSPTGVDISGITTAATLKVGTGVTASSDGDIFATGVCTATSFSGSGVNLTNLPAGNLTGALPAISGANLTGISGVSVASQADNRLITATGTTDALNAESNLTFDGTTLTATDFAYSSHPGVVSLTGNASTTTMTIASGHSVNSVLVVYNGVVLTPTTDYTISGTTLTLQFTPPTNSQVVVRYLIK